MAQDLSTGSVNDYDGNSLCVITKDGWLFLIQESTAKVSELSFRIFRVNIFFKQACGTLANMLLITEKNYGDMIPLSFIDGPTLSTVRHPILSIFL